MKVEIGEDSLVLRDSPGCLWLVGLFFIVVSGMLLYGSLGGFSNYHEIPSWQLMVAAFMSFCGIGVGLWVIYSHPLITTRLNRSTQRIEICQRGLRRKNLTVYDFGQVREFRVVAGKDDEGDDIFEIVMFLTNEQEIPLSHSYNRLRTNCETTATQLNQFLRQ